jgi:uncharacterized protein YcaQ
MDSLAIADARKLALHQQGLLSAKPKFGRGKKAVLKAIEHLGYIQIDAISVIKRAHHHTLWSRIPGYKPDYLFSLLSIDRDIFEYWSHAAAFLPSTDYQFSLLHMKTLGEQKKHWYHVEPELKEEVLKRIKQEGPLYARDFETPKSDSTGMWSWKPAKQALHELFMEGRITVSSRDGFQRLYDLPERVFPSLLAHTHTQTPTQSQYFWHLCQRAIQAHGIVTIPEIKYQRPIDNRAIENVINRKTEEGAIIPVSVGNLKRTYYALPGSVEAIPARVVPQMHFLSPFDNAVIQRKRVQRLFKFDYQTEIYYPVDKRKYGYFSLPILYGTEFIGRMDPKAHRHRKVLEIRNLVIEPGIKVSEKLIHDLKSKLSDFATFNNCSEYTITKSKPEYLKSALS